METNKKTIIGVICYDTQYKQIDNLLQFKDIYTKRILETEKNPFKKLLYFIKEISKIDILYFGYGVYYFPIAIIIAKILGKKVIMHWIGSDVLEFDKSAHKKIILKKVDIHLACSHLIASELKKYNIDAKVIPIIPLDMKFSLSKMPKKHAAMFYLPTNKEDFYGIDYLYHLAKSFPTTTFYVVGNEKRIFKENNIINLGRVSLEEMNDLYDKISILVRTPKHDGLSIMLLEALMRGKEVIYCYNFPYVHQAESKEQAEKAFAEIVKSMPRPNAAGREYVIDNYKIEKIQKELQTLLIEKNLIKE